MPHWLYRPLHVPKESCVDISIDFILGLTRLRKGRDFIFVVVDRFSKMRHFIYYYKTDDVMNIVDLFLEGGSSIVPMSIVSNRDVKYSNYF
jgi:hypothetical protein